MSVTYKDIETAAHRLSGIITRTPLLENDTLNEKTRGRIFLKAENLQRTGSFKFRGAYNALEHVAQKWAPVLRNNMRQNKSLSQIPDSKKQTGVVALSSGNHAQSVAFAAKLLGLSATIVMPSDAPALKIENTKNYGAKVILYDRATQDREAIAARIAQETGATLIHPFNDPLVIAGQGTVGLEMMEDCPNPDAVLVCTSGGGLAAGIGVAVKEKSPHTQLFTVEPEGFDDYKRSLETGTLQSNTKATGSICDALLVNTPGEIAFALNRKNYTRGLTVTDEEAKIAMRFALNELKCVVEPGGAVALAAILHGKIPTKGKTIVATLSGGNCDPLLTLSSP